VQITQTDYTALQERLKVIRQDRDKLDYNGGSSKPDVLKVKLDFLHTLNPVEASPSQHPGGDDNRVGDDDNSEARKEVANSKARNEIAHPESSNEVADSKARNEIAVPESSNEAADSESNNETTDSESDNEIADSESNNEAADSEPSNDNDGVLQSLFPYILDFLDLSALGLEVTGRLPLPLLLRKEYKKISKLIKKEPDGSRGSVMVSGQPGTGEFLVSPSHRV
jgi:hypothetical protein